MRRLSNLKTGLFFSLLLLKFTASGGEVLIDASAIGQKSTEATFKLGTPTTPDGHTLQVNDSYLLRDGRPWLPVMGEFHFSRYPAEEWPDELLKMKAGGITIVSTYVFWNHHEETQGQWDWTGRRNLREFLQACKEVDLPVVVRLGPWCHGEVREGGFPDWLVAQKLKLRTNDPTYLGYVELLYQQISGQMKGLLWKDGGPVIGVQLENEFGGPPAHLLKLKEIAQTAGIDVPIYTRTGWPNLKGTLPFGQLLPLFGAYAEGFWDRNLQSMPGGYWRAFTISTLRTDTAVATDQLGQRESKDEADARHYPFLTCELGGGMMSSYHRRLDIQTKDVLAVALCKVASGSNLPGYYMYHGGINPDSKTGVWLQESQASKITNYNDLPAKNYDFQAPLGACGEIRDSYHALRKLHLFLSDFGPALATLSPFYSGQFPRTQTDLDTVRCSVRSNGESGFLFVNNYQRGAEMPAKPNTQFKVKFFGGELKIPSEPVTLPAGECFVWPMNLSMGEEADGLPKLTYATAQPICTFRQAKTKWIFFAETIGVSSEFVFLNPDQTTRRFEKVRSAREPFCTLQGSEGHQLNAVLLSDAQSRQIWKGNIKGKECVVLSPANVVFEKDGLKLSSEDATRLVADVLVGDGSGTDSGYKHLVADPVTTSISEAGIEVIKPAGPLRAINLGAKNVAEAPVDADFDQAAEWKIKIPTAPDQQHRRVLRLNYIGDVARVYSGETLLVDDFYNGKPLDISLDHLPSDWKRELTVKILPLQPSAAILFPKTVRDQLKTDEPVAELKSADVVKTYSSTVKME